MENQNKNTFFLFCFYNLKLSYHLNNFWLDNTTQCSIMSLSHEEYTHIIITVQEGRSYHSTTKNNAIVLDTPITRHDTPIIFYNSKRTPVSSRNKKWRSGNGRARTHFCSGPQLAHKIRNNNVSSDTLTALWSWCETIYASK